MGRAFVVAFFVAALTLGATEAFGTSDAVRMRVAPSSVTAGGSVFVTAGVRPAGARCTGKINHGTTALKLRAKKAIGGAVSWKSKIPATAAGGKWTARVTCVRAGSASARFTVIARPPPPPPVIPAKVIVVKSGVASRLSVGGSTRFAGYGAVLQNVSPDEDALNVELTVNVLDANGLILDSESDTYAAIPAGATYYAGGDSSYSGTTPAARLEVIIKLGSHQKKSLGALPPVTNIRTSEGFSSADVLGEFANPYTRTLSNIARVTAVCFDASGNVIGGGYTYPRSSVTPGGRIGFDVSVEGLHAAQIASAQVSVEPDFTS
jgi:hypothetical protein